MQTKTYFASSVPAALDVARKELGPDAMLLNSKPADADARAFGRLEVTFAFEPRKIEEPPSRPEARFEGTAPPRFDTRSELRPTRSPVRATDPFAAEETFRTTRSSRPAGTDDMDDLRRQVEALRAAVGGQPGYTPPPAQHPYSPPPAPTSAPSPLHGAWARDNESAMVARLQRNGISEGLALELAGAAANTGGDRAVSLIEEIRRRIPPAGFAAWGPGETRIMAFVGPAGRGKTTSLVKIAVTFGLARRIPVRIYQVGGHGVGCQEQMARYAAILGVPFFACESLESLNLSLSGDGWRGLVLLDTPGISPSATVDIQELGRFFARRPEIERHLVLRADARSADMTYMVSRFSAMGPLRLLFTGTEESLTTGSMVETMIVTGLGSTFMGNGQEIPEDIEESNIDRLARSVCGDRAMSAPAAG